MRVISANRESVEEARVFRGVLMLAAMLLLFSTVTPAAGQSQPQAPPTSTAPSTDARPPDYFFPDLPPTALVYDGKAIWFRPIFAMVGDYTAFTQDNASIEQVGTQDNAREMRAARVGFSLRSKGKLGVELYGTADYQERRTREGALFQLYDLQLRVPLGPVKVTIGKQKEPISYELVGLSITLPQQERILLPFFSTRNIGVTLSGQLAGGRMTWATGAYNDWLETGASFDRNSSEYDARVTGLAWESPDKHDYLHLGVGWHSVGSDEGNLRFSGRPESNVTDKYVDSGKFAGTRAEELSLEGLLSRGRFSVLGERFDSWADAPASGDPHFSGYYLLGSWFITGESRPYVRAGGYAGGVRPARRFGAVEVVAKYSHLDIDDGPIHGGLLDKWHYGISWWASTQWKVGFSYGDADLDRAGLRGKTRMYLTRFQWLY